MPRPLLLVPYVALTVAHCLLQLADADTAVRVTQAVLMPLLALWFVAATPAGRMRTLVLAALGFSWLGDTLPAFFPDDDSALPVLIGCFLLAQACYIAAFLPLRARAARRWLPAYVVAWIALEAVLVPQAGGLFPAVLIYGAMLIGMAYLTTGVARVSAVGGLVFMVSDSMIALDAFDVWTQPGHDFWVMATYCVAQLLITLGVVRVLRIGSVHDDFPAAGERASLAG
ncbi:lysoplasmalogenase [Nocardioides sp. Kera G14]|uniref:lysoplasmalogenase n=1 Tax=Nocardioides sp. Kera G14 TaxID=2884264 RepID=UPI001D12C77E|nr:lysoplasmalogenase [Nocardioides sp. Kera G14]UDY24422.1 lysoplasmalogenase [Nocardioides sp. Kera G14]